MSDVSAETPAQATPTAVVEAPAEVTTETQAAEGTLLTAETKPGASAEASAKPAETQEAGTKPEEPAPPVKYELKLPEGSALDAAAIERVTSFAKERGLNNEQAQAVLEREHQTMVAVVESQKQELARKADAWVQEIKVDKELGGADFTRNVELSKRVVDKFGTDSFKNILNESGLGNHPELVRVFSRIAKQMAEDQLVIPNAQASVERPIEEIFYGTKEQ